MFIDEISLHLKAGKGGDGVVRWRHDKAKEFGGPSGGNGGKGGDVIAHAVRDVAILSSYKQEKSFEARDGENGYRDTKQGKEGKSFVLNLPIHSRIVNKTTGHTFLLEEEGQEIKLLSGGRGGLGNDHFKSSINVRPKESTGGEMGEEADFYIELELVVDYALIGLPNAGKSSLLNALTRAKSKVGDFPFTTLEPHLGELYGRILGDMPGLIRGASEGKGLGHKFLRHIRRTGALLHCVSGEESDPKATYEIVRKELDLYNKDITNKPEIILLTKVDLLSKDELKVKMKVLESLGKPVVPVSILDEALLKKLSDTLTS